MSAPVLGEATIGASGGIRRRSIGPFVNYVFALPALILFLMFVAYPILWVIDESLNPANGAGLSMSAYNAVLADPVFWTALWNMTVWGAITIPVQMAIGGLIAYFIERHTFLLKGFFRTMFFLPVVTSVSVVAIVWVQIYAPYYGVGQEYLKYIGIRMSNSPLGDPHMAIYALIVVNIWQWTGFSMLMYIAGIASLPTEVLDAAKVDGATGWRLGIHVVIPMLAPATRSLLLLGVLGTLQTFPIVQLMTVGGPNHASEVFGTFIFKESFILNDAQKGGALSVIVLVLALALSLIQIFVFGARLAPTKGET
jgi:multiple sugar transport system permease protein/raffinose/stachyose/melibiose transport system permease protein